MENVTKFEVADETSGEQNSALIPEFHSVTSVMEITNTELDESAVHTEANNQQSKEISPDLEEKREDRPQSLFAPFNHHMRPDPELVQLESAVDQEAATKLIKDRYKLMMEMSARRKDKEQRDKWKSTQISKRVNNENLLKTNQLSHFMDSQDIQKTIQILQNMHLTPSSLVKDQSKECSDYHLEKICWHKGLTRHNQLSRGTDSRGIQKTTQLFQNMYLSPSSLTEDQSEEFSDNHIEKVFWHKGLNSFIQLNYTEINTTANISSYDMLSTVTKHHENRVNDALSHMRNVEKDGIKRVAFFQASQKLGSAKRQKTSQIFFDEGEFIGTTFEELLDEGFERSYEI